MAVTLIDTSVFRIVQNGKYLTISQNYNFPSVLSIFNMSKLGISTSDQGLDSYSLIPKLIVSKQLYLTLNVKF